LRIPATLRPALAAVDHLLLAVPDLDAGIAWVEERCGVRASVGGSHPGRGTRNALLSVGGKRYLEILAPDPSQSGVTSSLLELTRVTSPTLARWAATATDLAAFADRLRADALPGVTVEGPLDGARATPDGMELRWRTVSARGAAISALGGLAPFFIEWSAESAHPAHTAPLAGTLEAVHFAHPEPESARATLASLGLAVAVGPAARPELRARIRTTRGALDLGVSDQPGD